VTAGAIRVAFNVLRPGDDREAIDAAIARVLDSGWFVLGPEVAAFEAEFAAAAGATHAVGVNTGTDAIALALRGLGIGPGDEVITAPLSAAYSALAIDMAGARPVFADLDPVRLTLDADAVAAAVTPRTRAVLPVHLYGQPADMTAIAQVAARHGLVVVEDACQAHGATVAGRPVGRGSAAAAYSFYPTKNLGALGDGGAVTTDDDALAARLRRLRNGGQSSRYRHDERGVNSRLDELQAAILRTRLPRLGEATAARRRLAARYRAGLDGAAIVLPPEQDAGHVYHLFPVLAGDRERFQAHLLRCGVETLVHYPVPIPRQPAAQAWTPSPCPVADDVCGRVLSLPLYPSLTEATQDEVIGAVLAFPR
jgi:dTDP-3-amino-3,4,6-trideoxy-alpha-D-glucose transaminase